MRKKNKLYNVNKWNKTQFAEGIDREHQNIFDGFNVSSLNTSSSGLVNNFKYDPEQDRQSTLLDLKTKMSNEGTGKKVSAAQTQGGKGWGQIAATAGSALADNIQIKGTRNGLYDAADPIYHLAGGKESAVGNGISDAGVATFKAGAASGNGYMMLAGAGLKIVGGLTNALGGIKANKEHEAAVKNSISANKNFVSKASSFDDVKMSAAPVSASGIYKGGPLSKGHAARKAARLQKEMDEAYAWADRSVSNNVDNLVADQTNNALANYAAFGGQLNNLGAIDYNFMSDYLTAKNKAAEVKDKMSNNIFGGIQATPFENTFAVGGDLQTHGSDWGTGMTTINAGGSHEENPYDGVQLGVDQEGKPNLLEEDETVFNNYVFSKRIKADAQTKKLFHLPKKSDISMADISKKINAEAEERPNDPISQNALNRKMELLAEQQERQKAEELQRQFESLPQEQQEAIIRQIAEQQQLAQQEAIAEQQGQMLPEDEQVEAQQAEQMQQPSEEEMMQMQQQQATQQEQQPMQEESIASQGEYAYGGRINKFDNGGIKEAIYGLVGAYTDEDWYKWYKNKFGSNEDAKTIAWDKLTWDDIKNNPELLNALTSEHPDLKDAIVRGYDFGQYKSPNTKYNLKDFTDNTVLPYAQSRRPGNTDGNYDIDTDFDLKGYSNIEDYENSATYKNYSQYMKDIINKAAGVKFKAGVDTPYDKVEWGGDKKLSEEEYNALQTLRQTANNTVTKEGTPVPMFTSEDDYTTLASNASTLWDKLRTDKKGGVFHLNPSTVNRNRSVKNLVQEADGSIHEIVGEVPKDWSRLSNYNYQDDKSDYILNYYKRPEAKDSSKETDKGNEEKKAKYVPIHKDETLRYAPMAGKLTTLGMRAAGIGKPKYGNINLALSTAAQSPVLANYQPIGDYLTYKPMDIWAEQNKATANSRATDRYIMNNNAGLGTKMAGLIANGYNNQLANNDLYRKALEYDDAQRERVTTFNRDTNKFNADAYNNLSKFNADAINKQRQYLASLQMQAAKEKLEADASWNKGIYTDVGGLFTDLGKIGKENAQHNMIADMAADNLFGNTSDKQNVFRDYIRKETEGKTSARGGKIKRRKG